MLIGIDGSRAFLKNRTGIEEYSYQVIKNLRNKLGDDQACLPMRRVVLYLRKNQQVDFELPANWEVKIVGWRRFWTQLGLSLEMLLHPVDVLFVPAHTVPLVHSKKTMVTIHGLEYEFCPEAYSFFERLYMRLTIKKSCRWASQIIAVSENTKQDLVNLYGVAEDKIKVIYEGYDNCNSHQSLVNGDQGTKSEKVDRLLVTDDRYLLFVGRIEERKNVKNIVKTFEILKEKYQIPHKLVLAGKPGYGYNNFKFQISNLKFKDEILELGFVSEQEKWELLAKADVFVFPTLYEGFGIPVLEAQSVGCPVVAGDNSSIPEVVGDSAMLVDVKNPEEIAKTVYEIVSNEEIKKDLTKKGLKNVKRFSWEKCTSEISELLK